MKLVYIDCNDTGFNEPKSFVAGNSHASYILKAITLLCKKKKPIWKMKPYSPCPNLLFVSLGRSGGSCHINKSILKCSENFLMRKFKSETMLVDQYWKEIAGENPPNDNYKKRPPR